MSIVCLTIFFLDFDNIYVLSYQFMCYMSLPYSSLQQDQEINHRRTNSLDDLLSHHPSDEHEPSFLPISSSSEHLTPTARATNETTPHDSSIPLYYPSLSVNQPHNRHSISTSTLYPYGAPSCGSVLVTRTSQTISGRGGTSATPQPTATSPNRNRINTKTNVLPNSVQDVSADSMEASTWNQSSKTSRCSSGNATPAGACKSRSPARSSPSRQPGDHLRVALNYLEDHHSQNETDESKVRDVKWGNIAGLYLQ